MNVKPAPNATNQGSGPKKVARKHFTKNGTGASARAGLGDREAK
jgi:hypothetical protein